jgi:molybdate transport system substrate-binding protein
MNRVRLLALLALVLGNPYVARAQNEVTLVAPGGIRTAIEQLSPGFERKTGIKINATFTSGGGAKQQVVRGDVFDVPIIQPLYPEVLASGNLVAGSATPLAYVAVGGAVRKGAVKPDISTAEALRRTLLAAKSISYPDPSGGAAAGVSFEEGLKKLGIAQQMEPKIKRAQGGAAAMTMAAKGEVEIGFTFLSEMNEPGLDVLGALPREFSTPTSLVGFVSSHAKNPAAAKALLEFLSSPQAGSIYKANGMQPGALTAR